MIVARDDNDDYTVHLTDDEYEELGSFIESEKSGWCAWNIKKYLGPPHIYMRTFTAKELDKLIRKLNIKSRLIDKFGSNLEESFRKSQDGI